MPRRRLSGLSLVEVLIALTILVLVGAAVAQVLQSSSRSAVVMLDRIQAQLYADQIHNQLQRSSISSLASEYRQFPQIISDPHFSAAVTVDPPAPDESRRSKIIVRWTTSRGDDAVTQVVTLLP